MTMDGPTDDCQDAGEVRQNESWLNWFSMTIARERMGEKEIAREEERKRECITHRDRTGIIARGTREAGKM